MQFIKQKDEICLCIYNNPLREYYIKSITENDAHVACTEKGMYISDVQTAHFVLISCNIVKIFVLFVPLFLQIRCRVFVHLLHFL